MINRVNVAEAKRRFSDLLGRVAYGKERVTITRRGRPMAILIPPDQDRQKPHLADAEDGSRNVTRSSGPWRRLSRSVSRTSRDRCVAKRRRCTCLIPVA